jgi:uncharacterized membrane protein YgaE (UPF0421/DUF939 family)
MTALRLARRRLRDRSLAIAQTAVASLAAWYLCVLLLPDPQPVFACIATVVSIGATHGAHRQRALHLVAGVVLGLSIADVLIHVLGTGAPQLALLVVLAMSCAVLLNGSDIVVSEAAVSSMLLVMAGPAGFSPNRALEAIVGGAVALAVVVLFPPNAELRVDRAAGAVFGQLGRALERVASALEARDPDRADAALAQARAISVDALEHAITTGVETVRTAPPRFAARAHVERYARSCEQLDLAVRNTRVLARHAHRALRAGGTPSAEGVAALARSVWELAAAYDEPRRAVAARDLAGRAAASAADDALGESVRSTAVDLMRAAELVAGEPDELPSEELLLGLSAHDDVLRATAELNACPFFATLSAPGDDPDVDVRQRPQDAHQQRLLQTL